jgi:ubiquinone/menaquinone biosynthesis C-methylase UbiE
MPTRRLHSDPYETFAPVYDQNAHAEVTAGFFRAVRPYLPDEGEAGIVLDLGCGTGSLTALVAANGHTVIGVDRSPAMIKLARKRCRPFGQKVRFVQRELTSLRSLPRAVLALACADVVNHVISQKQLRLIFQQVQGVLQPGGVFFFDALNRFCFERYWDDKTYYFENTQGDLVMTCTWNAQANRGKCSIVSFEKIRNNEYKKTVTHLTESYHQEDKIHAMLRAVGFKKVESRPWSPWPDQDREPSMDRTLWMATA